MRRIALVLGLSTLLAVPAAAQIPVLDIRLGAQAALPTGDLADAYDTGFGAYARLGAPIGPVKLMGSLTWTRLRGKNVTLPIIGTVGIPDQDVVSVQVGPHFSAALLDIGVEGAYFSEFDKFGFAPNVSLGLMSMELTASYNIVFSDPSKATWLSVGAGFRF